MWFKTILILLLIFLVTPDFAFGQTKPAKKSSKELYENIESYSGRSEFTKFMYRLFFKPVNPSGKKKKVYKKLIQKPYSSFEGKIIRNINIVTLDPFGQSIADTIITRKNFLVKTGNALHMRSQSGTIRDLLLIRKNQPFDSLLMKESERLVRARPFVRDVSFFISITSKNSDSIDVFIRELDNWSIFLKVKASGTRLAINLADKNFLGLGHEFTNSYMWHHSTGGDAYNANYYIPSIRNSYISTTLNYGTDEFRNTITSISVDRPFYSSLAKWAGGIKLMQLYRKDTIHLIDSLYFIQRYKFNSQDYWAGNSIQIFKGNTENNRTTNFITAVRFLRIHYLDKPIEIYDTLHVYSDENFYLAAIGISQRKFVQDKYILKFGVTEDVPIGKVFGLTGGYQERNNAGRLYLGARAAYGNYFPWGYISTNVEYGSFFSHGHRQQQILSANIIYFTGLIEIGKWKFRQFVKPQAMIGMQRYAYDSLTLNDGYGLNGFVSHELSGTSRLLITLQTQSYAPWDFIGFRFGPFINCSLGMLGDQKSGFRNSKIYAQLGFGIIIKNDYLVLNAFQLSISFYPLIPGVGNSVFKMNSFRTTDFSYDNFEFGKPEIVGYH